MYMYIETLRADVRIVGWIVFRLCRTGGLLLKPGRAVTVINAQIQQVRAIINVLDTNHSL